MSQVAVGAVNLDDFEAGRESAAGGGGELVDQRVDFADSEFVWDGIGFAERDGAGRDGLPSTLGFGDRRAAFPGAVHAGLAARMGQLNAGRGAL